MKVKCLYNKIDPTLHNGKVAAWANNSELEITVGETYVVLAIAKSDFWNGIIYFVLGDERNTFPLSFPAELFEIVDTKVSKYWNFPLSHIESLAQIDVNADEIISFKEWSVEKGSFYERLLDDHPRELEIFMSYVEKMTAE